MKGVRQVIVEYDKALSRAIDVLERHVKAMSVENGDGDGDGDNESSNENSDESVEVGTPIVTCKVGDDVVRFFRDKERSRAG